MEIVRVREAGKIEIMEAEKGIMLDGQGSPLINKGDAVSFVPLKGSITYDGLYVLQQIGDVEKYFVKRLQLCKNNKILILPDNDIEELIEIDLSNPPQDLTVVGRVLNVYRKIRVA